MPLLPEISVEATADKNKLRSDVVWIDFLEAIFPGEAPVRVCNYDQFVTWAGHEWIPVEFTTPELEETKDAQVPDAKVQFYDIDQQVTPIIDRHAGAVGAVVILSTALSTRLANPVPERQEEMEILNTAINHQSIVTFTLGAENLTKTRLPTNRYLKNHCRYKKFKEGACRYIGAETECDRTFARCRELGQQTRFGGVPAMGQLGYKV